MKHDQETVPHAENRGIASGQVLLGRLMWFLFGPAILLVTTLVILGQGAQQVLTSAGVSMSQAATSRCPEEFAEMLRPTDLLLMAHRRQWGILCWRSGSALQRVVERAAGPVAIRAVP